MESKCDYTSETVNPLTEAILRVGDMQKNLVDLRKNLQKFQLKALEIGDKPGFEAITIYTGLVLALDAILKQMFVGFKLPQQVVSAIREKEVITDPDFVKGVAIN